MDLKRLKLLVVLMVVVTTCSSAAMPKIGIGVITNTRTRASETFKFHDLFKGLTVKDASGKKMDIVFSENPVGNTFYFSGEVENYRVPNEKKAILFSRMTIIDENKKGDAEFAGCYFTRLKLQIWKGQKFQSYFADSVLYVPTVLEETAEQFSAVNNSFLYDESFELLSPLLLNLFDYLQQKQGVRVTGLKNGKIFKFDLKAHIIGSPVQLQDFLSSGRNKLLKGKVGIDNFNEYFENNFTTIANKELFFIQKYGGNNMMDVLGNIAYPKTCWKEAVKSYIDVGDQYYARQDYEAFVLANWSALILANQLKEKIEVIFQYKRSALQNLLKYANYAHEPHIARLLQFNIALIDGMLSSGVITESGHRYDITMEEFDRTFRHSQDVMNDLRHQERSNRLVNTLGIVVTMSSAINDGLKGNQDMSEQTKSLLNCTVEIDRSSDESLRRSENNFQAHFANIDFNIPKSFFQPEGNDLIDYNKAILYLECMKLIYADQNNSYWGSCFESFASGDDELNQTYLQVKLAPTAQKRDKLVLISKVLSKFERNAFITEKFKKNENPH